MPHGIALQGGCCGSVLGPARAKHGVVGPHLPPRRVVDIFPKLRRTPKYKFLRVPLPTYGISYCTSDNLFRFVHFPMANRLVSIPRERVSYEYPPQRPSLATRVMSPFWWREGHPATKMGSPLVLHFPNLLGYDPLPVRIGRVAMRTTGGTGRAMDSQPSKHKPGPLTCRWVVWFLPRQSFAKHTRVSYCRFSRRMKSPGTIQLCRPRHN